MITRHLVERLPDLFGKMRQVSAIAPGVLGTTGVESLEIIRGVKDHINPDCIIVIDALSSRKLSRLCKTVQITDTGIIPGSGVGNTRSAINKDMLGVPVIAIGVPTVVDIATIVLDIAEDSGVSFPEKAIREYSRTLMVTPKEIDVHIVDVGRIIGYAINTVFQKGVTVSEMDMFLS
jgi:spore protease